MNWFIIYKLQNNLLITSNIYDKGECIRMGLKSLSNEKIAKMSLIELTKIMMLEEKKEMKFKDAFIKVAELKGLSEKDKKAKIGQYYTDLNVDGNFVTNGSNMWGLKSWHRGNQGDEEEKVVSPKINKRKKRNKEEEVLGAEFAGINSHIDEMNDEYLEVEDDDFDMDEDFADEEEE